MVTLYQLAQQTKPGDRIRWVGKDSEVDDPQARTAKRVVLEPGRVSVEAEGPRDGQARFWVEENGESQAFYGENDRPMGPVRKAQLPKDDFSIGSWRD